jgi:hypothetical protein
MRRKFAAYTTLGGRGLAEEVRRGGVLADWLMQGQERKRRAEESVHPTSQNRDVGHPGVCG